MFHTGVITAHSMRHAVEERALLLHLQFILLSSRPCGHSHWDTLFVQVMDQTFGTCKKWMEQGGRDGGEGMEESESGGQD